MPEDSWRSTLLRCAVKVGDYENPPSMSEGLCYQVSMRREEVVGEGGIYTTEGRAPRNSKFGRHEMVGLGVRLEGCFVTVMG